MDQSLTSHLDLETSFSFGSIWYRPTALHRPACSDNMSGFILHWLNPCLINSRLLQDSTHSGIPCLAQVAWLGMFTSLAVVSSSKSDSRKARMNKCWRFLPPSFPKGLFFLFAKPRYAVGTSNHTLRSDTVHLRAV